MRCTHSSVTIVPQSKIKNPKLVLLNLDKISLAGNRVHKEQEMDMIEK